jgi:recombination protein RecA
MLELAQVIPTGSLRLDIALGIGGIPRGHVVEIYGPDSSGKTTLCQHILAQAQKSGGSCAFIDADHSLDPVYAQHCGVDVNQLLIAEPANTEQALEIIETLAHTGALALIILDSFSALPSSAELHTRLGETTADTRQDSLSLTLQKLSPVLCRTHTTLLFTNRAGDTKGRIYHDLAAHPSRLALNLRAAQRLELCPLRLIREKNIVIGSHIQVKITKNSFAPCFQSIELDIIYGTGIQQAGEVFDLATELKLLDRQGPVYFFGDLRLGTGRDSVVHFLEQNQAVSAEIEQVIRQKLLPPLNAEAQQQSNEPGT